MLDKIIEKQNLWEYLKQANKPIVIYGMGDGALKIIDKLALYGLAPSGIFASDGFVRGHYFQGFKVCTLSEIKAEFSDFIILLAFAAFREPLLSQLCQLSTEFEMYAPDVPVCTDDTSLFTLEYLKANQNDFDFAFNCLSDNLSKQTFLDVVNFKISGKIDYLTKIQSPIEEVYTNLLNLSSTENYVDLGAYNGDTIKEFLSYTNNEFESITAFEPDKKNFKKLSKYVTLLECDNINIYNYAASDTCKTVAFSNKSGRNSAISSQDISENQILANSVDNLLYPNKVSLIKFDVEGEEINAILGCEKTIRKYSPALMVSAYHRNYDLFYIPKLILSMNDNYNVFLRHHPYIPAWETNFYFIPK